MAKVNLLPPELRKAEKRTYSLSSLKRSSLFLLSLSLFFFLAGTLLIIVAFYQKKMLTRLGDQFVSRHRNIEMITKKNAALMQELNQLNQEIGLLVGYLKRDIIWSEKLSQLRGLIFKEVWLTELSFEKRTADIEPGRLAIRGGLIPQEKTSPIGTLSRFINQLKEDETFFADFDNLDLIDSRTEIRKGIEITNFSIEMALKKPKPS